LLLTAITTVTVEDLGRSLGLQAAQVTDQTCSTVTKRAERWW